ncbi:MAG: hypothetical protein CMG66_01320 [Candidatus Marinimicrobia bacterium]|nr:hypothetical protein [Candidatus Neomarinimicrobiota bacterium]|tara:strand:+ start:18699 stop:19421 length:723 start_codon:yes stop_codon:yes gene_type:complete
MFKNITRYITAAIFIAIIFILAINYIALPSIANKNKELYLPDVRGLNIEQAKEELSNFNVKIFYTKYKEGYSPYEVLNMSPRAFTKVKEKRDVKLTVIGQENDIILDDFTNKSFRTTTLQLDRIGILIDTLIYEYSESVNKDNIISQYPKKGKKITKKDKITLIVSSGMPPDYYVVPSLVNLSLNRAIKKIYESGLLVGKKEYEYVDSLLNNTVIQQDQPAFKRLSMPIEINLIISTDEK